MDRVVNSGEQTCDRLLGRMNCQEQAAYDVRLTPRLLRDGGQSNDLRTVLEGRQVMLITTPTVASLLAESVIDAAKSAASTLELVVLPCNEATKSMRSVEWVCERAAAANIGREGLLVALGGGVCSDLVTLAAGIVRRGIDHVRLPTTLVAQIDAAIGIKGAVNHVGKKSYLGVFHPPRAVLVDPTALVTLPARAISNGLAEIIKIALVRDADLFEFVAAEGEALVSNRFQCEDGQRVIARSIEAIMQELQANIFEDRTYERRVDLGHTFSPAVEAAYGFSIDHGAAVAIDIALSAAIGVEVGSLERDQFEQVVGAIASSALPMHSDRLTPELCVAAMVEAERHRGGDLNLVVPAGIGDVIFLQNAQKLARSVIPAALDMVRSARFPRQPAVAR